MAFALYSSQMHVMWWKWIFNIMFCWRFGEATSCLVSIWGPTERDNIILASIYTETVPLRDGSKQGNAVLADWCVTDATITMNLYIVSQKYLANLRTYFKWLWVNFRRGTFFFLFLQQNRPSGKCEEKITLCCTVDVFPFQVLLDRYSHEK